MIQATVERMYTETEENRFLEVTYANGDKEVLYFKDFNSGAMIQNIVDRAKKMAIKDFLDHDQKGLRVTHLLQACVDEFKENEDLPEHHQPRRLGPHLRQEGRADRVHPHAHHRQAGHRAGPVDRHGRPTPASTSRPCPAERRRRSAARSVEALLEVRPRARSVVRRGAGGLVRRPHRAGRRRARRRRASHRRAARRRGRRGGRPRQLALGIVSLVAAIPISVVLGRHRRLAALLVAWVGIVLVNMAHALQGRPPRPRRSALGPCSSGSASRSCSWSSSASSPGACAASRAGAHEPGTRHRRLTGSATRRPSTGAASVSRSVAG